MHIMVLDTEGYSNVNAYNLGYTIVDLSTQKVVYKDNIAVLPNLFANLQEKMKRSDEGKNAKLSELQMKNTGDILTDSGKKYKLIRTEMGLYKHFAYVFKKYPITDIFAFNVPFDRAALKRTLTEKHYNALFSDKVFKDIQTACFYAFCYNLEYIKWAVVNGYTTDCGNVKTTAEVFYRYIFGKSDFSEEHTALADAEIETDMLLLALSRNPDVPTKTMQPYIKLNELYDKDNPETINQFFDEYLFSKV